MAAPELRMLTALCRLRRIETDAARRALGAALAEETALAKRATEIGAELGAARRMAGEFDREAFAAWFGRMRADRAHLEEALRAAEAHTAAAQSHLAQSRVAETAAGDALAAAKARRDAAMARGDQLVLEDVARALRQTGA